MVERILVTGGTGKTGSLVAEQLVARGVQSRIASRHPSGAEQVRFEWDDPSTFAAALDGVQGAYLVAPTNHTDHLSAMRPFLELAVARVPGRLVLLSASSLERGNPFMGEVHAWLYDHAPSWTVLRPSWFMQNFVTERLPSILHDNAVTSATGDGRVPFIDAWDIAAVAVAALTLPNMESREHILTGPEALTYDEAAKQISEVARHPVRHHKLSLGELTALYVSIGLSNDYAPTLAAMDAAIAAGSEDRVTNEVAKITGRPARPLRAFLEAHAHCFRLTG